MVVVTSARMTNRQYLTEMVMISAQKISERLPSAASGEKCPPVVLTIACSV
jgi:hypothetical protein